MKNRKVKIIVWDDFWKKTLSLVLSTILVLITIFWLIVSLVATSFFFKMGLSLSLVDGLVFWFFGFLSFLMFSNEKIVRKLRKYNSLKVVKYAKVK